MFQLHTLLLTREVESHDSHNNRQTPFQRPVYTLGSHGRQTLDAHLCSKKLGSGDAGRAGSLTTAQGTVVQGLEHKMIHVQGVGVHGKDKASSAPINPLQRCRP